MRFKGNAASDPNACFPAEEGMFLRCTGVQHLNKDNEDLFSKSGNPMWILEMTVEEGPSKGRKLWHYLVWIPEGKPAHGMVLKALKAFGIDPEGDIEVLPEHLEGTLVKADVKIDNKDPQYEPKNVIGKWYTPDGSEPTPEAAAEEAAPEDAPAETAEEAAGTAQEPDSFDPAELERQNAAAAAALALKNKKTLPPTKAAPKPLPKPAPAPAKKPLWGKKK